MLFHSPRLLFYSKVIHLTVANFCFSRELFSALGHLSLVLDQILEALDGSQLASVAFSDINPLQVLLFHQLQTLFQNLF